MDVGQCGCVILNYNDAETTVESVRRIHHYGCISHILVVDNCSTDDSWEKLDAIRHFNKVICFRTDFNGGYGYGNNIGVRYARDVLGEKAVLIVNPDVVFSEECLHVCLRELQSREDAAVISPLQLDSRGNAVLMFAWNIGSGVRHVLSCEVFLRHTFFPLPCVDLNPEDEHVFVDCVPGSFLLIDADKFLLSGGYAPEMFLYWEETILGHRIKSMGWKTVLLPFQKYYHHHSVSINKSMPRITAQRQVQYNSLLVCLREVWSYGEVRLWLARLFLKWCLLEEKALALLKQRIFGRIKSDDE